VPPNRTAGGGSQRKAKSLTGLGTDNRRHQVGGKRGKDSDTAESERRDGKKSKSFDEKYYDRHRVIIVPLRGN